MSWFFIALVGPILYAIANHVDKYLIAKYMKGGAVGSLIIFSCLFSAVALPVVLFIHPDVLATSIRDGGILAINGMLVVFAMLCYFYALEKDEVSYVVPFYQTVPIFGFILGFLILGETITSLQGLAMCIIIAGALILSFEITGPLRFKKHVVLLMILASFLYAVNGVIFKLIALPNGFWISLFWSLVGNVIIGLLFLLFIRSYREQFFYTLRKNRFPVISLNGLAELLFTVAEGVTAYAILLAPVALVLLVNSFQPFFVFAIGVLLTLLFPHISEEGITRKHLFQKVLGIGLMVVGTYFIGF